MNKTESGRGWAPTAIAWDMDGTIVDTEKLWIEQCRNVLSQHQVEWQTAWEKEFYGSSMATSLRLLCEYGSLTITEEELYQILNTGLAQRLDKDGLEFQPNAKELVTQLGKSFPSALVTASYLSMTTHLQDDLKPFKFDQIVTGEQVENGKPHPEPYLEAARRLGVRATEMLVIEDSCAGSSSAYQSGAKVVIVTERPDVLELAETFDPDRIRILPTLEGQTPQSLVTIFND